MVVKKKGHYVSGNKLISMIILQKTRVKKNVIRKHGSQETMISQGVDIDDDVAVFGAPSQLPTCVILCLPLLHQL